MRYLCMNTKFNFFNLKVKQGLFRKCLSYNNIIELAAS